MKYYIFKGFHYSLGFFYPFIFKREKLRFSFKLSKNIWFSEPRNIDDKDINKLYGFKFSTHHHHIYSVRLGYVPSFSEENKVEIFAYWYNNGKRGYKYLTTVSTETEVFCYFRIMKNSVFVEVDNSHILIDMDIPKKYRFLNELYPYYGGDNTSPTNAWIKIKRHF